VGAWSHGGGGGEFGRGGTGGLISRNQDSGGARPSERRHGAPVPYGAWRLVA
jgi:hypothetical protein